MKQSVKYMKRYAGEDYTFIINRVKLDDRGEYIIKAENHYGFREEVVFLNVQREFLSTNSIGGIIPKRENGNKPVSFFAFSYTERITKV